MMPGEFDCWASRDEQIKALLNDLYCDEYGRVLGYELHTTMRLPCIVDAQGRKSATFCYGLEYFDIDRWCPVKYASFDLKRVEYVKAELEKKVLVDFRIVRFERNTNLG